MSQSQHIDQKKITLDITGMHCASCATTIDKALNNETGVSKANVNITTEKAYIEFDPKKVNRQDIIKAIKDTGYGVGENFKKDIIQIGGMTCASCAQAVEQALRKTEGILEASVNIATEKAMITYDPQIVSFQKITKVINDTGYKALERDTGSSK